MFTSRSQITYDKYREEAGSFGLWGKYVAFDWVLRNRCRFGNPEYRQVVEKNELNATEMKIGPS